MQPTGLRVDPDSAAERQQTRHDTTSSSLSPTPPPSSTSSNQYRSDASDEYDRQEISAILPPSRRFSATARRPSAADTVLLWMAQGTPEAHEETRLTINNNSSGSNDNNSTAAKDAFSSDLFTSAAPPPPTQEQKQQDGGSPSWQSHISQETAATEANVEGASAAQMSGRLLAASESKSETPASTVRDPFTEPHSADADASRAVTTSLPLSAAAAPPRVNSSFTNSENNESNANTSDVPLSFVRYRSDDTQQSSLPSSTTATRAPLDATMPTPLPENSTTHVRNASSNKPPSSHQQQRQHLYLQWIHNDSDTDLSHSGRCLGSTTRDAPASGIPSAAAAAALESRSHPDCLVVPTAYETITNTEPNNGGRNSGVITSVLPFLAESTAVVIPVPAEPHVRFSSDLDIIEAAPRAPTSIPTVDGTTSSANAAVTFIEHHTGTEMHNTAAGAEADGKLGNSTSNLHNGGGVSSSRHVQRHSAEREGDKDTHALSLLLTPDELQLERLKAYDQAARYPSDNYPSETLHGTSGHRSDNGRERWGDEKEGDVSTDRKASNNSNATRQYSPQRGTATTATRAEDDSDVTTLDFLKDTTTTILPEAFTSMFATTTSFLKMKTEAMVNAMPQPFRRAMSKTGESIASAADATGSMLSNVGVYAMRSVPDRVMSPKWKYLIFVDAVNVLKCSLNVNILVAPYVFRMAGLVGGLLLIFVTQVVCWYYTEVYFRAKGELKGANHVIMYGDVPRITFGRWYPVFQLWYDGIALVATVAYAALNTQALLPHMKITGNAAKALSFIIPSLFSLPLAFMKRARTQPPMMTLASILIFVSLIMMFTVFPYGSVVSKTILTIERPNSSVAVLHLFPQSAQEFFVAIGICVFIFTPLSRAVPVERTMQPRRYIKLLRVCVVISTVVHVTFGVCAIVSYGSKTCSVLSTSFNNHHTSVEVAVMSLLFFAFLFYIPLNMFELGELCDRRVLGWRSIPRYGELGPNILRLLFLIGCALIAWCIPYYGLLISLSGCLGYSVVAIVIPAALDYVCRVRYGLLRGRAPRFLDYVITFSGAALGGIVCLVGVVMTSYEMWLVIESGYSTC